MSLLDYREVAALLGCSERTVRRLVLDGELPAVAVRNSVRFNPEDVREFINLNTKVEAK